MNSVEKILKLMSATLEENEGPSDWSKRLKALSDNKTLNKDDYYYSIKRLFAGMGSLNDVVIMDKNGGYPVEANEKFDSLRHELSKALEDFKKS